MATSTTTLRVPSELRDEIARIAAQRGTTMLEVVADAIERLGRDEWWSSVHGELDQWTDAEAADYAEESSRFGAPSADGLDAS